MSIKISITNLQGEFHNNILEFSYQAFFFTKHFLAKVIKST